MYERRFSPRELSEHWGYSVDTIQRWAEGEEGVLQMRFSGRSWQEAKDHAPHPGKCCA
jgi:hypothetical protein